MLTTIYRHSYQRKKYHTKEKGDEDLLQYVPVEFLHASAKEMNIDERFCERIEPNWYRVEGVLTNQVIH